MSQKALIFNKVNGSFVDGYGIRTTIFLKGCPLRCKWCCNPEGQSFSPQLRYLPDHCNGCGRCVPLCPKSALSLADGIIQIDRSLCDNCGQCVDSCWQEALRMSGELRDAEDVFAEILREKPYFDRSGGGLTIGGGEASAFPEFCLELIGLCHRAGISVAVDSCGHTLRPAGVDVLKAADLILFDLKGMDPEKHRDNTGVSNETILDNFRLLTRIGKPVIVRLPIIPGYTDGEGELEKLVALLAASPNVERVDVLPFHTYGRVKYDELGMEYPLPDTLKPLADSDVAYVVDALTKAGLNAQIGG